MGFDLSKQIQDVYEANKLIQEKIKAKTEFRNAALRVTSVRYFQEILNLAISKELQERLVIEIRCGDYDYNCTVWGKFNEFEYSFHLAKLNDDDIGWRFHYETRKNWTISEYCPFNAIEQELIERLGKWQNMPAASPSAEDCDEDDDDRDDDDYVLENYSDYYDDDETP